MKESLKSEKIDSNIKNFNTWKNNVFNKFYFCLNFFLIASYKILKNNAILINLGSFFQGKDSLQVDRFQFYENKFLNG